jgi:hypothetical protein
MLAMRAALPLNGHQHRTAQRRYCLVGWSPPNPSRRPAPASAIVTTATSTTVGDVAKVGAPHGSDGALASNSVEHQRQQLMDALAHHAGPSSEPPADLWAEYDAQPLNQLVMALFRRKMVAAIGNDVPASGYQGIIDLTRRLNGMGPTPRDTQARTVGILCSLFPAWLPALFKVA